VASQKDALEGQDFPLDSESATVLRWDFAPRGAGAWKLVLAEDLSDTGRWRAGVLTNGRQTLQVRGVRTEGAPAPDAQSPGAQSPGAEFSGAVFERDGKALAAVDLTGNGVIWLAPELKARERGAAVCASAALLLSLGTK
jgi:hypothetical protein